MRRRRGVTLIELTLVVTMLALIAAIALRHLGRYVDRAAARGAIGEAAGVVTRARDEAVAQRTMVTVRLDTALGEIVLHARGRRIARVALASAHGVRLSANRDSMVFGVRGLGWGAANLTLVATRGSAAETLVVSRLGRVRY